MKRIIFMLALLLAPSLALGASSNYYTGTATIKPFPSALVVGGTYTDSTTGSTIEKVSLNTTLTPDSPVDSMMVYSRFTAVNSSGEYMLVHGTDSTSAWIVRLSDNVVISKVDPGSIGTTEIGENQEIRWDYTGSYPNRIYFVYLTKFYQMDVISDNGNATLLYNVTTDYPAAVKILNDVEGDSSSDSRYWAWQVLGAYTDGNYPRIAFVVYDKQLGQLIGHLDPGDVTPIQNASSWTASFPKPNMVEISPDSQQVMINYGRSYDGGPTEDFTGTVFDGPHLFDLDFTNPIKVGITETHSGWGYDTTGKLLFVHHMNRFQTTDAGTVEDTLQACYTDGTGGTYPENCFNILNFKDYNYVGQHLARMPVSKPGWILMSTYKKDKIDISRSTAYTAYDGLFYSPDGMNQFQCIVTGTTATTAPTFVATTYGDRTIDGTVEWYYRGKIHLDNMMLMVELKPMAESPRIWKVAPSYNEYAGGYRDEGSASISQDGNSIFWTANWNDATSGHGEVYKVDLPSDWITSLGGTVPIETCSDGIQNQDETGIDCGGSCDACETVTTHSAFTMGAGMYILKLGD